MPDDLAFLSLTEAVRRIRSGDLSPVKYTQALLGRIAAHDGQLDSFLRVLDDGALEGAALAELAVKMVRRLVLCTVFLLPLRISWM